MGGRRRRGRARASPLLPSQLRRASGSSHQGRTCSLRARRPRHVRYCAAHVPSPAPRDGSSEAAGPKCADELTAVLPRARAGSPSPSRERLPVERDPPRPLGARHHAACCFMHAHARLFVLTDRPSIIPYRPPSCSQRKHEHPLHATDCSTCTPASTEGGRHGSAYTAADEDPKHWRQHSAASPGHRRKGKASSLVLAHAHPTRRSWS